MMPAAIATHQEGRIIIDHVRTDKPSVTHVKGLVLANSIEVLKHGGFYDRYLSLLPAQHRDAVLYAVAPSWVPVDVALAHYQACDGLMLTDDELETVGALIAKRVAETFLGTVFRTTRKAGVETFWYVVKRSDRFWDRAYLGGAITVIQTGPKDVIVEWRGLPLVESRYFRIAQRYYSEALATMFCSRAYVKTIRPRSPHPHSLTTSFSWV